MQLFGVIYSASIFGERFEKQITTLTAWDPTKMIKSQKKLWTRTEKKPDDDGVVQHGKWLALLTKEQFKEFINEFCLEASSTETMGSIGGMVPPLPGYMTIFHLPAISFLNEDARLDSACVGAYVTPFIVKKDGETPCGAMSQRNWDKITDAVVSMWGDSGSKHAIADKRLRAAAARSSERNKDRVIETMRD